MIHKKRGYSIYECSTVEELAEKLTYHTWCACNGFRLGNLIFLNDSFSADSAQEYAVIRDGRQIESLTVSWIKEEKLVIYLQQYLAGGGLKPDEDMGPVEVTPHKPGYCMHCA